MLSKQAEKRFCFFCVSNSSFKHSELLVCLLFVTIASGVACPMSGVGSPVPAAAQYGFCSTLEEGENF